MTIEVISTAVYRSFDLIFGRVKSLDEEDQYTAVIVMYPPGSLRESSIRASQNREQKKMVEIGRYIVETGSLDEISKYKEIGIFSEWPRLRTFYIVNDQVKLFGEMSNRDLEFGVWVAKTLKEYAAKPKKRAWWERLLRINKSKTEIFDISQLNEEEIEVVHLNNSIKEGEREMGGSRVNEG